MKEYRLYHGRFLLASLNQATESSVLCLREKDLILYVTLFRIVGKLMALLHGNNGYTFTGFVKSVFFSQMCWFLFSSAIELMHDSTGSKELLNVSE